LAIPDGVVNGNWKRERKEMKEKTMRKHGVVYILPIQWWLHPSVFLVVPLCVVRSLTFSHSSTSLYGKCDDVVFGSNLNAGGVVSLLFLWPESNGFQHKGEEKEREKFTTRKFLNSIVYTYLNAIHSGSDEFFFSFLFLFRTSIKVCC
jgi:hypothetical protein